MCGRRGFSISSTLSVRRKSIHLNYYRSVIVQYKNKRKNAKFFPFKILTTQSSGLKVRIIELISMWLIDFEGARLR